MLRDLVKKPQKDEHNIIWYLRIIVIILFLIILIGSFAVMNIRMAKENPTISTTFSSVDAVLTPSIYLSFAYIFNISCWIYYDYKGINETSCNEYVTQPKFTGDKDYPYGGIFTPKGIKLTRYNDIGPYFVYLKVNITDPTFSNLTESFFRMNLYDSENDYDIHDIVSMNNMKNESISPFEESLFYLNKYTLTGGYLYKLGFSRKIREILGQPALSYIGLPSNYNPKPYIESSIQGVPAATLDETHLKVRISPRDFIIDDEQEQSSIVFIYVFLFGVESMKPWGYIHSGCCGLLPTFNEESEQPEPSEHEVPDTMSIDKRVRELEELINCLITDTRKSRRINRCNSNDSNSLNSDNTNDDSQ
ncbi:hypothetical protein RclHR1_02270025 [Rhizophagus clarus]|uniref:Uncharacterized protein n=1 Tax=Rhizophagus clarus TaxID=94130 RepID=A0A2Z6RAL7_9GLOM|nr:hypothetical protein RclHR1_02270025 [Rhizophagus clarus]